MRVRPIILTFVAMAALFAMAFYSQNPLVQRAQTYARDVATASAVVYVSLRSVNALLSTAQEIEVGGALVVQGTAQPLKVLEPIDDTVERVAGIVFYVMVFTGVLAVALGPVSAVGNALLALAVVSWAVETRWGAGAVAKRISRQLGMYGAFLGIAVPLAFVVSAMLADRMTQDVWARNDAVVREITADWAQDDLTPPVDTGWFSGARAILGDAARYQELVSNVLARADELVAGYVAILSVFLFKILVLPLMVMGGFLVLVRMAGRSDA